MKKNIQRKKFLEELKRIPIVQVAAEKSNLSRNTIYRWRKEDAEFLAEMEKAMQEGEDLINDLTESQLLSLIKDQDWRAVSFWLRLRNPKFKEKVEVQGEVRVRREDTPEERELLAIALRRATAESSLLETNQNKDEN